MSKPEVPVVKQKKSPLIPKKERVMMPERIIVPKSGSCTTKTSGMMSKGNAKFYRTSVRSGVIT